MESPSPYSYIASPELYSPEQNAPQYDNPTSLMTVFTCLLILGVAAVFFLVMAASIGARRELICTVGSTAVEYKMYPYDGLCHYLFYTHVFVHPNYSDVRSTRIATSYRVFLNHIPKFNKTGGGLSFDVRASNVETVIKARRNLKKLEKKKILHYGSLNVIDFTGTLVGLVARAVEMIKELKQQQGGDPGRRTVIAIGGINYGPEDAWKLYKEALRKAAAVGSGIDTVISITSANVWHRAMVHCRTLPPAIISAKYWEFPSLNRHMEVVTEANESMYENPNIVVGLSLEMGALLHEYDKAQPNALSGVVLYERCRKVTLVPLDMGCESDVWSHINDTNISFLSDTQKKMVLLFDNDATVEQKVQYVLDRKLRKRFAWLYYDVNMADFVGRCGMINPFLPIYVLRWNFDIHDRP